MAPPQRRRSIDSSSSSSKLSPPESGEPPSGPGDSTQQTSSSSSASGQDQRHGPPPSYTRSAPATMMPPQQPPPSGYRIPLSPEIPFPGIERSRGAPFTDADGKSPVFVGSALMQYSVHPCKIAPNQPRPCYVSYGGVEITHQGRYDLLPFVPEHMEFVKTSNGLVPPGRRPVKGGFENDGKELYHAAAVINGVKVPGKTGPHLGGCNIPFDGMENVLNDDYEILCWKF